MVHLTEDEDFAYGGYARATIADVMVGDGVRFDTLPDNCRNIVMIEEVEPDVFAIGFVLRSVANARIFSDAFGRVIDGMADDLQLTMRRLPGTTPVHIRL